MLFRSAGALILVAMAASSTAFARDRYATPPRQDGSPSTAQPEQPQPNSAASDYNNHVVESGMTQDKLDRTPAR